MTVLLVNAPTRVPLTDGRERFFIKAGSRWPFSIEKSPRQSCRYVPFPFSLAYLAALLERQKVPTEVFDGVALNVDEATFLERCVAYQPSIILMEATTPTIRNDLEICRKLKERTGALVALCGGHPTTFAEQILRDCPAVDWVFKGEYELNALEAILEQRAGGAGIASVPGLVRASPGRGGERVVTKGPPGKPIYNLDSLPFPARHMFPTRQVPTMWPYWDGFCQRRPAIQMHASRGCPFRCTFCLWISVIYEHGPYRTFSPKRVVDEMEEVVQRYNAREIYFDDDIFTVKEDHVVGLCEEIRARGLKVAWSVMGDAMVVTKRSIDAMADAGCIGMKFGIESVNDSVLKKLRKPIKADRVREVTSWCAKRGIKTHATITFGLEGDTPESMQQTLGYCCDLPVDSIQFSVATPFPGTEHYQTARQEGRIIAAEWGQYDGARFSVLRFENMPAGYIEEFTRKAPSVWLRARLRDGLWRWRQARYFWNVLRDQGFQGLVQRMDRVLGLLLRR